MVNRNFNQFIKAESKHEGEYLGSDQPNAHKKNRQQNDSTNSSGNTNMSVGAIGRDIFKNKK